MSDKSIINKIIHLVFISLLNNKSIAKNLNDIVEQLGSDPPLKAQYSGIKESPKEVQGKLLEKI